MSVKSSPHTPQIVLAHFNWSLVRFKEAIANEDTEYYQGAALHRFRLTYEVALKAIRAFAKAQGHTCTTDESCFQWVKGKQWLEKGINSNAASGIGDLSALNILAFSRGSIIYLLRNI